MGYRRTLISGLTCALVCASVATGQAGSAAPIAGGVGAQGLTAGQLPSTTATKATTATTGSISGVVRGSNGRAVSGYTVEAFTADGNFVADTVTNSGGSYTLAGLQRGTYKVRVSGPRTAAAPWAIGWVGGASSFLNARTVAISGPTSKADVTLQPAATVTGWVKGVPRGSEVRLCGASFLDCRTAVTDARGNFVVRGLPAGTASVVVRPVGGSDLAFPAEPPRPGVPLRANQTTTLNLDAAVQAAPVVVLAGKRFNSNPPPTPSDAAPPRVISAVMSEELGRRYVATKATDGRAGSGLAQVQLRIGDEELEATGYTSRPLLVPGDGEVSVRVTDKAGNSSDWVVAR